MTVNKGIITVFSLVVGCGVVTAVSLLYMSRTNSEENGNGNGNRNGNQNQQNDDGKDITNIKNLFKKYEKDNNFDRNDDDDRELIKYYEGQLTEIISKLKNKKINYNAAKEQVDKIFDNYSENKRSYSIASDDSDVSLSSISGGKKIKRNKNNRSKNTKKSKKLKKSKSKSKIYKKLI